MSEASEAMYILKMKYTNGRVAVTACKTLDEIIEVIKDPPLFDIDIPVVSYTIVPPK